MTSTIIAIALVLLCMGMGSVQIPVGDGLSIIWHKLLGQEMPAGIDPSMVSILWEIRMPRVITAFFVGAALSVSGAIMQSLLQNPLASSYTMGVSAGASLGAALVIITGITGTIFGMFLLPVAGFSTGLLTVILVMAVSARLDRNLQNHTIILFGMVFSLFVNAILTMLSTMESEHLQRLVLWQMGSFSGKRWPHAGVVCGCAILGTLLVMRYHRELDIMTFGEEQAMSIGVDTKKTKILLMVLSSFLTGAAVCFSGIIGFVDLTIPHMVRRLFGATHRVVLPMSMILGGAFMALADTISRTLLSPREIPVGAVTAFVGAPFFLWVYFHERRA
ncbi:MAG: iron ABC transporter permease [Lachnospiraceae bacterium]|nr:iron ABC transporter permease [Lachnospiraceae bacterium]